MIAQLKVDNGRPKPLVIVGYRSRVWFTPTRKMVDRADVRPIICDEHEEPDERRPHVARPLTTRASMSIGPSRRRTFTGPPNGNWISGCER